MRLDILCFSLPSRPAPPAATTQQQTSHRANAVRVRVRVLIHVHALFAVHTVVQQECPLSFQTVTGKQGQVHYVNTHTHK